VNPLSTLHWSTTATVGNVSDRSGAGRLSDAIITRLNTGGKWRFRCGSIYNSFVTNAINSWTSQLFNTLTWSTDQNRDGTFECGATRQGWGFSEGLQSGVCEANHVNWGETGQTGCYSTNPETRWGLAGSFWAR